MDPKYDNHSIFFPLCPGDGSASTFWDNMKRQSLDAEAEDGPPFVTADVLPLSQPAAKLIVIFRDPVERFVIIMWEPFHESFCQ